MQPLWIYQHVAQTVNEFTWDGLSPAHHGYQLSLPQLIQAGEQGLRAVWLGVVMPGIDHRWLNGLQDTEQGDAGAQGRGDAKRQRCWSTDSTVPKPEEEHKRFLVSIQHHTWAYVTLILTLSPGSGTSRLQDDIFHSAPFSLFCRPPQGQRMFLLSGPRLCNSLQFPT